MNELGKAESAFGKSAQEDYTDAAARAFGPKPPKAKKADDGLTDALRGTYDTLIKAARAKAQTYVRRGTTGANDGSPSLSEVASDISAKRDVPRYGSSVEPSYARGGLSGANPQTTVDIDGATVYLGDVDANDAEALKSAEDDARRDLAWMKDNDYIVED